MRTVSAVPRRPTAPTACLGGDLGDEVPSLAPSDTTNCYIYGPGDLPIEQINNSTGTVTLTGFP
jgi:hypothetical protein